jgi:hypothetical protein
MEERDRGRLIANLKSLPHELEHLTKDLSPDELRWRPIPNKWTVGEIICHLRDVERDVFQVRLRRSLFETDPVFDLFDQERACAERSYLDQDHRQALADFHALRDETVEALMAVPLELWERSGTHPQRGTKTVEEQVTHQVKNHDMSHLIQIRDILRIRMPW